MEAEKQEKEEKSIEKPKETSKPDENEGVFSRSEYAKKDFWNERFIKHKSQFDWYLEYKELKVYFDEVFPIKKTDKILMVGCGNSRLSEEMYDDGYLDVINIDISDKAINQMKAFALKKNRNMTFLEMDATQMTFDSEYFDVIIDKGTLDALICGKDYTFTDKLMIESMRVLKKNGKFFVITHGNPEGRRYIYERSLGFSNYTYEFCKQRLCETSQLINIMRANLVNKPLNHIMKDKTALLKTMIEFMRLKKQKKDKPLIHKIVFTQDSTLKNDDTQELHYLKEKSPKIEASTEETQEEEEEEEEEEEKKEDEPKKEEEKTEEPKKEETQTQEGPQPTKTIYNPIRQSFCFIYQITKN